MKRITLTGFSAWDAIENALFAVIFVICFFAAVCLAFS